MPESKPGGEIRARFVASGGVTQMGDMFCRAPLKIAKTFPQSDGSLHICTMDCSPGLLAGDHYAFDWHVESGAQVHLTNQSFTRVHPSRERPCRLEQRVFVGAGARLELFPEPTMLFADAALNARTEIEVESGGTLLMAEILCVGRIGRGEVFAFHRFCNRVSVRYGGKLAFTSQTRFCPDEQQLRARGAWGDYTHWGNFLFCGEEANAGLRDAFVVVLECFPRVKGGVSLTTHRGVSVSLLGHRAFDLQAANTALRLASKGCVQPQGAGERAVA